MENSFLAGTVAEESNADIVAPVELRRKPSAHSERNGSTDDRHRAEEPNFRCADMHRAAAPMRAARAAPENLGEERFDRSAERKIMRVRAVRAERAIRCPQMMRDADCDRLLSDGQVTGTAHLVGDDEFRDRFFGPADQQHLLEKRQHGVGRKVAEFRRIRVGGRIAEIPDIQYQSVPLRPHPSILRRSPHKSRIAIFPRWAYVAAVTRLIHWQRRKLYASPQNSPNATHGIDNAVAAPSRVSPSPVWIIRGLD